MRTFVHPVTLDREFASHLEGVDAACLELREFLACHGLATRVFPIELTTRECLNNAVLHGNRRDSRRQVRLSLRLGRRWLRVTVQDEGPGFPWRRREADVPGDELHHGRGFSILLLHARRVSFNRRGNAVTLWFDRNDPDSAPASS